ncbi:hypothetical protein ACOMHN_018645 [Nucella lapillus]
MAAKDTSSDTTATRFRGVRKPSDPLCHRGRHITYTVCCRSCDQASLGCGYRGGGDKSLRLLPNRPHPYHFLLFTPFWPKTSGQQSAALLSLGTSIEASLASLAQYIQHN